MNPMRGMRAASRRLYRIGLKSRWLLPRQRCHAFGPASATERIERIYVINLDRQSDRWNEVDQELSQVLDSSGDALAKRAVRYPAIDARSFTRSPLENDEVDPFYTLADQLFVEPQPRALPDRFELDRPIRMSRPEVAVARSHIGVWRRIAAGEDAYALVIEDDAWFRRGFARYLDRAWRELEADRGARRLDMLYLSYMEVKHGAQKALLSRSVFRPVRGLWWLSGYVLSREGAGKLLGLLPCRGPVDLWVNHQFGELDVRATRQSIISQRRDGDSTNSYSILPALKIGVLDCEGQSLFQVRPQHRPVFAFGAEGSGLSSLAMAISMLGYRCCSDVQDLPEEELDRLLAGGTDRVFDAYVNIGSLQANVVTLRKRHPGAKFIVTTSRGGASNGSDDGAIIDGLKDCDVAVLRPGVADKWKVVCEHLRCAPPVCSFPEIADLGQRPLLDAIASANPATARRNPRRDRSPWVVEPPRGWRGIRSAPAIDSPTKSGAHVSFYDCLEDLDAKRWLLRDDTFAGNLALFRRANVECRAGVGAVLSVRKEPLGVRDYSAAAISSRDRFRFGRFEATLQATKVPGVVTGFFLHRDSPRQEIDVEIVGKWSNRLLVNVFYNPGDEGVRFDYGYRGAPSIIELGFDASESAHRFAIEWDPGEIRWLVDDRLIHRRVNWDPTPIPQLPMTLHVNTWPSGSRELAGRLAPRQLPATVVVRSIAIEAILADRYQGPGDQVA